MFGVQQLQHKANNRDYSQCRRKITNAKSSVERLSHYSINPRIGDITTTKRLYFVIEIIMS